MNKQPQRRRALSEQEVDDLVTAEAANESAWGPPVRVSPRPAATLELPAGLAARAAFLARLHHQDRVESWLTQVIRERIELEELAFSQAKRELLGSSAPKELARSVAGSRRR